jgi:hypothetical protein
MTVDGFLKIDGIQGESTDPKKKDEIRKERCGHGRICCREGKGATYH